VVIVYGIPNDHDDLSIVLQQLRRGSRGPDQESEGIWMIEEWAEEQYQMRQSRLRAVQNASDLDQSDLDSENGSGNETDASTKRANLEKAKKRLKLSPILQRLFRTPPPDCQDTKEYCYRRVILENHDDRYDEIPLNSDQKCCSNCYPVLRLEFEAKYHTDLEPSKERWKKTGRIFQKALHDPVNKLITKTFPKTYGLSDLGIDGVMSAEIYKKLCNAGFGVTSLDDLNVLLHDWLLIDRLGVQLWNIMQDIQSRQEDIERKWDEEVDAPKRAARKAKNSGKETSPKKAAVLIADSSRQHPITDPRLSTPAILRSNAPSLHLLTPDTP
jgi:hypothetical protein